MPVKTRRFCNRLPCLWSALTGLLGLLILAGPAGAVVISISDMARGFSATPAQCASVAQAVWTAVGSRGFCIRYYLSTAGGQGPRPAVFLEGDRRSGRFDPVTGAFVPDPAARDIDTENLGRFADRLSRRTRTTAIYLARIGVDGSSGHNSARRSVLEAVVLNQALDLIKRRHGLDGFHLAGQSGGGANIGALLALRADIGCAVPGSAPLALVRRAPARADLPRPGTLPRTPLPPGPARAADPLLKKYNSVEGIPAIIRNRPGRILVVSDPFDQTVPFESQSRFVRELIRAGGAAEQYVVEGSGPKRHGVTPYALEALSACIDGRSRDDIARALVDLAGRRRAAVAARAQGGAARPPAPPRGPGGLATAPSRDTPPAASRLSPAAALPAAPATPRAEE